MVEKLKGLIEKYYEQLAYLFFGGLATLLNIVLALVFRWMGMPTTWNTLLDNVVCILFAYCTNASGCSAATVREWTRCGSSPPSSAAAWARW